MPTTHTSDLKNVVLSASISLSELVLCSSITKSRLILCGIGLELANYTVILKEHNIRIFLIIMFIENLPD